MISNDAVTSGHPTPLPKLCDARVIGMQSEEEIMACNEYTSIFNELRVKMDQSCKEKIGNRREGREAASSDFGFPDKPVHLHCSRSL